MKYRRLSNKELEPLHEEFLKYLLVANITPENWEELKKNDQKACQKHIDIFSDLVFDKILQELSFIDVINKNRIEVYQFFKDTAYVFILENVEQDSQDLSQLKLSELNLETIHILKGEKRITQQREEEIFAILNKKGASISQGDLYKKIALLTV